MINHDGSNIKEDFSEHYLGNYRLTRLLGQGGFAYVYLGEHRYLKRLAAIKVLRTVLAEQEKIHFLEEAKLLANLSHPHIVRVFEFAIAPQRSYIQNSVVIENIPFLVLDYIAGGNLRTIYPVGTRLFLDTVVTYVKQAADALYYAHTQHIIHRDIKPENLLLNAQQEIMLSDFGLALFAPQPGLLSRQSMAGTLPYTAPEQLRGKPEFASDQYSLGILAYEWLCGSHPFRGGDAEIIMQHISSPPPRLRTKNSSLSQAVEDVILKALAKDPQQRHSTIREFAQALEQASKKPKPYFAIEPLPTAEASVQPSNFFPFFYYFSQKPPSERMGEATPIASFATHHQTRKQYTAALTPVKQRNRQRMIQKVRIFWITGVLEPSLHEAPFITPELRDKQDAVATPWPSTFHLAQKHSPTLAPGTSITEIYDQSGGELLILGEAGSGKTTLLLQLARDLLDRAEQNASVPIPVIFPLSSWVEKQLPIDQWLVEELNSKYQIPRLLAGQWLHAEILVPLLDGLDEVNANARSACIIAINTYKQNHGLSSLVVCSRFTEYLLYPPRVHLQRAVVVQSLTMQQITDYFLKAGEKFQEIYQILRADPILQRLITTPLMLNIITLAYQDKAPVDLLAMRSSTERQQHIFHTYVEQMLQRHPTSSFSSTPQQSINWLSSLARKMQQQRQVVFYIEQIQPTWIDKERWQQMYMWIAVLLPGALIGGLTSLLSNDLFFHAGDFKSVLLDAIYGLLMGFLFSGRKPEQTSLEDTSGTQRSPEKNLFTSKLLITPIFLGLTSILFLGLSKGWPDGLINGTYLGIMSFLMNIFLQRRAEAKNVRKLIGSQHPYASSKNPFFEHLTNGLIIGPICGVSNILTNVIRQGILHYSLLFYLSLGIRETLHNCLLGILISLLLLHTNDGIIHRAEIVVWSWKRFWHSFRTPKHIMQVIFIGITVGLTYGLKEALEGDLNNILSVGLSDTLLLALGYGFVFAVLQGVSSRELADQHRYQPNEGIYRSLRYGLISSIIGAFVGAISYIISIILASAVASTLSSLQTRHYTFTLLEDGVQVSLKQGLTIAAHTTLLLGLAAGLLIGLLLGCLAVLQHSILRLILWKTKALPLKLDRFLDYATTTIFLHKVGGGYMFIHRFLLEYFASINAKPADDNEEQAFLNPEPLVRLLEKI